MSLLHLLIPPLTQDINHPHWIKVINTKIQSLTDNKTWLFTSLPPHKKAIGYNWIYKTKFHVDGTIERHKARLLAQEFTQVEGIDFFDISSLVAKLTTVRLLLSLSSSLNLHLHLFNVLNVFLYGDLDEEVYTALPKGITPSFPT